VSVVKREVCFPGLFGRNTKVSARRETVSFTHICEAKWKQRMIPYTALA
jgi:hypothetical protein